MSYTTTKPSTSASSYDKPLPVITPLTKGFWDHTRAGRLSVQICTSCGDHHFPASPVCPRCLGNAQEWRPVAGRGTMLSWIEFHRAYWPSFAGDLPYRVCLVRLEEGPLFISNLIGDTPEMGGAVEVVFEPVTAEITLPKFRELR